MRVEAYAAHGGDSQELDIWLAAIEGGVQQRGQANMHTLPRDLGEQGINLQAGGDVRPST